MTKRKRLKIDRGVASDVASSLAQFGETLEQLEQPVIRQAVIKRLMAVAEKTPVLILHQICITLEANNGDE